MTWGNDCFCSLFFPFEFRASLAFSLFAEAKTVLFVAGKKGFKSKNLLSISPQVAWYVNFLEKTNSRQCSLFLFWLVRKNFEESTKPKIIFSTLLFPEVLFRCRIQKPTSASDEVCFFFLCSGARYLQSLGPKVRALWV